MICLYEKTETNFTYNGLGTLEPTECSFFPSINGVWTLKMTLPIDPEGKSNLIANDRIIKVTDIDCIEEQTSDYQLFRIYDFRKEQNYVYVTALPVGLDARFDTFVRSLKLYNKTAAGALSDINNISNKYTVSGSGYDSTVKSAEFENANIISILNGEESFVTTWDGEICYDNYNLKVNHRLGTNSTPLDVRYGKNIMGMSYDLDASNVITRLYPIAASGELLNADTRYRLTTDTYVDSDNAIDYPIPHIYTVTTPYSLVQLSNDGSAEYTESMAAYTAIKEMTTRWLYNALTGYAGVEYEPLLTNIELGWIVNNYALTMSKDGVQGIVEYLSQQVINNSVHSIQAKAVKDLIFNAMMAGFDDVLKNTDSPDYIGSTSKKMWEDAIISTPQKYYYSYTWDPSGEFRVNGNGEADYAWVYESSKWQQLDDDGITTGATDKTKWKWYKVKNKSFKRYGNKKKNRYLKDQWWNINDVWYKFTSDGQGKKGAALMEDCLDLIDAMEVWEQTLVDFLTEVSYTAERSLFELLYNQMTDYCEVMFDNEQLSYPTIKLEIDMVDLSRTEEYKDYEFLERIHLGNEVRVYNPRLMPEPSTVRVIGLTYDVLRKCNTEIKIGITESSVINLLNSIGQSKETKYVAGDGITIENNVIKVNPPETPYLTDCIVNGESKVRNHIAYIDLDEMGIDETIDVIFGIEEPDSDDGEDKDIYVKIKEVGEPYSSEITMTYATNATWSNSGITKNADDSYNITITGIPTTNQEYVSYKIEGLEEGKRYKFEYDYKIVRGTDYYSDITNGIVYLNTPNHYNLPSFVGDIDTPGWYEADLIRRNDKDNNLHHYEDTFYATADTMYFEFITSGIKDGVSSEIQVSNLLVDFITFEIEKVFFKYEDRWMKAGVTANPTGTATDTLTKIKINGVIYNISGSGGASAMSDLTDVNLTNLANGQILKYDSSTQKWINVTESGGASAVSDLTDVDIDNLENGQILKYNSVSQKWENSIESGSGGTSGGKIFSYHAEWITSTSSATGTNLTDTLTLPSGRYIVIAHTPPTSASQSVLNSDYQFVIKINDVAADDAYRVFNRQYGECAWFIELERQSTLVLCSGVSTSITWVAQYLERGGMDVIPFNQLNPLIYSEDEREVGTWIDDKPLYAKTVETNASVPGGAVLIYRQVLTSKDCLYYTKTADTPGSGTYNSLSEQMVHYCINEKLIGTWTDGKPLYQKTIQQEWTTRDNSTLTISGLDSTMVLRNFQGLCEYQYSGVFYTIGLNGTYTEYPYDDITKIRVKAIMGSSSTYKFRITLTVIYTKTTD